MRQEIKMIMLQDTKSRNAGEEFTVHADQQADYFEEQGIAKRVTESDSVEAEQPAEQVAKEPDGVEVEQKGVHETQTTHVKKTRSKKS